MPIIVMLKSSGVVIVAPGYATAIRVTKGWIAAPVGQHYRDGSRCLNDPVPVQWALFIRVQWGRDMVFYREVSMSFNGRRLFNLRVHGFRYYALHAQSY